MINFFRRTRKQLADHNKPMKYARYAIGEIVLVVIGILIALQINNWNEERIAHNELSQKLKSQIEAMRTDRVGLLESIEMATFRIYGIKRVLKLAGIPVSSFRRWEGLYILPDKETQFWKGPYPNQYNREFIEEVFLSSGSGPFTLKLNSTVFEELVTSGLYSKIQNDSLKTNLNRYYATWNSETTIKYTDVLNRWREALRKKGALIYDLESVENPLNLLTESPETAAALKEVLFESIWQGHLIHISIDFIDQSIQGIDKEILKSD